MFKKHVHLNKSSMTEAYVTHFGRFEINLYF